MHSHSDAEWLKYARTSSGSRDLYALFSNKAPKSLCRRRNNHSSLPPHVRAGGGRSAANPFRFMHCEQYSAHNHKTQTLRSDSLPISPACRQPLYHTCPTDVSIWPRSRAAILASQIQLTRSHRHAFPRRRARLELHADSCSREAAFVLEGGSRNRV